MSRLLPSNAASDRVSTAKQWWRGLTLVLLATLFLSLQNNLVKLAQAPIPITVLGGMQAGGYVTPDLHNPFQVPLLVLLVRITFLLPLLWVLLPSLRPGGWQEARQVMMGNDHVLKLRIVAAGVFLFLSQTLNYFAISKLGPATAVTLFFIYPTITTLLAWWCFGERPAWKQWVAIGLIYLGCAWLAFKIPVEALGTDLPKALAAFSTADPLGSFAAIGAGAMFALEGIIAQACFRKINPATFTSLVFTVEWLVLSGFALFIIHISLNVGLLVIGLLLCLATLTGYLFNNFGIREIGAAATAIIGASGPAVTAILGVLMFSDGLKAQQWAAIGLVTVGVVLMNLARVPSKLSQT